MRRAALWIASVVLEIVGFLVSTVVIAALTGVWGPSAAIAVGVFLAFALLLVAWIVRRRYAMRP